MKRPQDLPDFVKPPLVEVVMGIQFAQPEQYHQILAHEVWSLFRAKFPLIEEKVPLDPTFEVFGQFSPSQLAVQIKNTASHDRYWFKSLDDSEVIQFQNDRLLHNWRKHGDESRVYPRFEAVFASFSSEIEILEKYFASIGGSLNVNQCEISYINHLPKSFFDVSSVSNPFSIFNFLENCIDDLNFRARRNLHNDHGEAFARLYIEINSAQDLSRGELYTFNLTVKGAPSGASRADALNFLAYGREEIVNAFAKLTTDGAHERWGRVT